MNVTITCAAYGCEQTFDAELSFDPGIPVTEGPMPVGVTATVPGYRQHLVEVHGAPPAPTPQES